MPDHPATAPSMEYGVVVGDDGSANALLAVRFAADEARRRGTTLDVVRAWTIRTAVRPADAQQTEVPSTEEFQRATVEHTERRIAEALGPDAPRTRVHAVHGNGAKALVEMSSRAEIVVVGDRGIGGLAGRLLGSTADTVIREAHCPVTVVRTRTP